MRCKRILFLNLWVEISLSKDVAPVKGRTDLQLPEAGAGHGEISQSNAVDLEKVFATYKQKSGNSHKIQRAAAK